MSPRQSYMQPLARIGRGDGRQDSTAHLRGRAVAIENRCSHEDAGGRSELDEQACSIERCRHGSRFDLRTGRALNLPASQPVDAFDVVVDDGTVTVEI